MKALDIYRVDDSFLHQINSMAFIVINLFFCIILGSLFKLGLPSLWAAQIFQNIFIICMLHHFYLNGNDVKRSTKFGKWVETYKDSPYNTQAKCPPYAIDWDFYSVHLSKKVRKETRDHDWASFR